MLSDSPLQHRYRYDVDGRLQAIQHPGAARSFRYEKSVVGLITRLTETAQAQSSTWQYGYDASGRLLGAFRDDGRRYQYTFDNGDNLTGIGTPEGLRSYRHDAGNKIAGYKFDANGSRIEDERHSYQWDAENRLTGIGYRASPQRRTEFRYDGLGRRIAIIEINGPSRTETRYSWCGEVICAARDGNGRPIGYYFSHGAYRPQEKARRQYYARDHLDSIRDVLDEKGQAIARYDYDPYGNFINQPAQQPEFGYAGMHYHAPSGLYLTRYRAYDPQSGRWLSRDPIEEGGGINLYAYVEGDPVSYTDPLGLQRAPPPRVGSRGVRGNPYVQGSNFNALAEHLVNQMRRNDITYTVVRAPGGTPYNYTYSDVRSMERTLRNNGFVRENPGNLYSPWVRQDSVCYAPGARPGNWVGPSVGGRPGSIVGRGGSPMTVPRGTNDPTIINGISYSGHAIDQMQGRGIPPSIVQNTIQNGVIYQTRLGTTGYYDSVNNVRVITNSDTGVVITVIPGSP